MACAGGGVAPRPHQTGHNSGVIHSGLYYKPGSHKARELRRRAARWSPSAGATASRTRLRQARGGDRPSELPAARRARAPRPGQRPRRAAAARAEDIREHEPHAVGLAALRVPETGIVDFVAVARGGRAAFQEAGGEIILGHRLRAIRVKERAGARDHRRRGRGRVTGQLRRAPVRSRRALWPATTPACASCRFAASTSSSRTAPRPGQRPDLPGARSPVPVPGRAPDTTRRRFGGGRTQRRALARSQRLRPSAIDPRDVARRSPGPGCGESRRAPGGSDDGSCSAPAAAASSPNRSVDSFRRSRQTTCCAAAAAFALRPWTATASWWTFHFVERDRTLHVLNAPSPAATSSLAIGAEIARRARERFIAAPSSAPG